MPDNTTKFTGRVSAYTQYRSPYPAADILAWLRATCGLTPAWRLADLAAGTGMLTEVLLSNGNPVTAIEPNPEMRAACATLQHRYPTLDLREGTAEATGLPDRSLDLLTAARAFHWFDPPRAATEFRRILRPGGWVVLISSGSHTDVSPQAEALRKLEIRHGANPDYIRSRADRLQRQQRFLDDLAVPGHAPQSISLSSERHLDWTSFAGFIQSTSSAPLPQDPRYPAMQAALRTFFETWSHAGLLSLPEICTLAAAQLPCQQP